VHCEPVVLFRVSQARKQLLCSVHGERILVRDRSFLTVAQGNLASRCEQHLCKAPIERTQWLPAHARARHSRAIEDYGRREDVYDNDTFEPLDEARDSPGRALHRGHVARVPDPTWLSAPHEATESSNVEGQKSLASTQRVSPVASSTSMTSVPLAPPQPHINGNTNSTGAKAAAAASSPPLSPPPSQNGTVSATSGAYTKSMADVPVQPPMDDLSVAAAASAASTRSAGPTTQAAAPFSEAPITGPRAAASEAQYMPPAMRTPAPATAAAQLQTNAGHHGAAPTTWEPTPTDWEPTPKAWEPRMEDFGGSAASTTSYSDSSNYGEYERFGSASHSRSRQDFGGSAASTTSYPDSSSYGEYERFGSASHSRSTQDFGGSGASTTSYSDSTSYGEYERFGSASHSRSTQDIPLDGSQAGINLKALDWNQEVLVEFKKNFYIEHPEVSQMTEEQHQQILDQHEAVLEGHRPHPRPLQKFEHAGFPEAILRELQRASFTSPTSVQAIGWPVALSGRDMIAIASTGSGKTLGYLLPGLVHIAAQPPVRMGDGPVGLVLVPTRELAIQIQLEAMKFGQAAGFREACVYGGVSRRGQEKELRQGVDLVIATPGRLLDFLEAGVTNLKRVTYLVLDEADRMLDMGFEPQLRRIVSQVRPERQTLLWSATWPREVQHLARDFCREDPMKVTISGAEESRAARSIKQEVIVTSELDKKMRFLDWIQGVAPMGSNPRILIFTETKRAADALQLQLRQDGFSAASIHGDKAQNERDRAMQGFRTGHVNILVATDVAQRGLDIKDVNYVVNYDVPKTVEDAFALAPSALHLCLPHPHH